MKDLETNYAVTKCSNVQINISNRLSLACSPSYRKHVGTRVHHDEEKHSAQVEARQLRVVLRDVVQQDGHFLNENGVKGQQELRKD